MNFPDNLNYQNKFEDLTNDSFENNSSLKKIISLVTGNGIKQPLDYNPLEGFSRLSEIETYLFNKIDSFVNPNYISNDELIDVFHKIQLWGGSGGRKVYQGKGFYENFDLPIYKKIVSRCLTFEKKDGWVREVSNWTFDLHKIFGISTSFSTKHIRFWLYKKLKDNTLPIFDEVIQGKKDKMGKWISGLNKLNPDTLLNRYKKNHLIFYWEQMIKKSKEENVSLLNFERTLFNYFRKELNDKNGRL